MSGFKIILLLDDNSKTEIKTNISSLASRGITFITNLAEITDVMLEKTKTVVVLEGYMRCANSLADMRLFKSLLDLEYIYIGTDESWLSIVGEIAQTYRSDISLLNIDILQAAFYKDRSLEMNAKASINQTSSKNLASKIIKEHNNYGYETVELANSLLSILDREATYQNKLNQLTERVRVLESENLFLRNKNSSLMDGYNEIVQQSLKLNEALKQYEIVFTKPVYQKLDVHKYQDRPAILYLKEQESFSGLDLFLETLFSMIQIQEKQSVKILRLYDNSGCRRILTLPKYYQVITNRYLTRDIDASDFICKSGDYTQILENLLLNRLHLDVLIIVDCKDVNDVVLTGSFMQYDLCGRYESFRPLGLSKDNTVTNTVVDDPEVLQWNSFETKDLSKDEHFIYLSAKPVMQQILQEFRKFSITI